MARAQLRALMWSDACSVHRLSTRLSGTSQSASVCLSPWGYKIYSYSWRKWWWLKQFKWNHMVKSTLCTSYFCLLSRSRLDCTYVISLLPAFTCHKRPHNFVWHLNFSSKLRFMITCIPRHSLWMESSLRFYIMFRILIFNCMYL